MDPKDVPAFPHHFTHESVGDCSGMTLRDYFAAKAMQALIASRQGDYEGGFYDETVVAESAYLMADAMLKAREE